MSRYVGIRPPLKNIVNTNTNMMISPRPEFPPGQRISRRQREQQIDERAKRRIEKRVPVPRQMRVSSKISLYPYRLKPLGQSHTLPVATSVESLNEAMTTKYSG